MSARLDLSMSFVRLVGSEELNLISCITLILPTVRHGAGDKLLILSPICAIRIGVEIFKNCWRSRGAYSLERQSSVSDGLLSSTYLKGIAGSDHWTFIKREELDRLKEIEAQYDNFRHTNSRTAAILESSFLKPEEVKIDSEFKHFNQLYRND